MSDCTVCARKAQLFVCFQCQSELRLMLEGLAIGFPLGNGRRSRSWLLCLEDAANGSTRLGESARRATDKTSPVPFNERASEELGRVNNTLGTWVRHLAEARGVVVVAGDVIALAKWLARHIPAIACDEAGGELYTDIKGMVDVIDRIVNRAVAPKYCGPCPSLVEDKHGQEQGCTTALYAPWDHHTAHYAVEIECWKCHGTHNVDRLVGAALDTVAGLLYTATEVQEVMRQIGEPIPSRTWRHWRAADKIIVRGWREGEPMYWINDVKDLMAQRPQNLPTGAAAHRAAG